MKKSFALYIFGILLISSCNKISPVSFTQYHSFPGAIDSIAIYVNDSGDVLGHAANAIKFNYDEQRRVNEIVMGIMAYTSSPSESEIYLYAYTGNSTNPSSFIDSTIEDKAYITKHNLYYNDLGQKIKDTVVARYDRRLESGADSIENKSTLSEWYSFDPESSYNLMNLYYNDNSILGTNLTNYNSAGDIVNCHWRSFGDEDDSVIAYYPEANPFYALNIRVALQNQNPFTSTAYYPLSSDIASSPHLFKTFKGKNTVYFRTGAEGTTYINCTYSKNTSNQIDVMVLSNSGYNGYSPSGYGTEEPYYTTIKFYYHQ